MLRIQEKSGEETPRRDRPINKLTSKEIKILDIWDRLVRSEKKRARLRDLNREGVLSDLFSPDIFLADIAQG